MITALKQLWAVQGELQVIETTGQPSLLHPLPLLPPSLAHTSTPFTIPSTIPCPHPHPCYRPLPRQVIETVQAHTSVDQLMRRRLEFKLALSGASILVGDRATHRARRSQCARCARVHH